MKKYLKPCAEIMDICTQSCLAASVAIQDFENNPLEYTEVE